MRFLFADPGRDVDDDDIAGAEEVAPCEAEVCCARPRARVGLFSMPLFCPDRVVRECVPIMMPDQLMTLDGWMARWGISMLPRTGGL